MNELKGLLGKVLIEADLVLDSGLHIGGADGFSAIGAIDSPVVRDMITNDPYIPGSSLKGKMRYLLSRIKAKNNQMPKLFNEEAMIKRLFGSSGDNIIMSRLQFYDIFIDKNNVGNKRIKDLTDESLTESKYENTIDRLTAVANPRQIERVVKGVTFNFKVSYSIENENEIEEDFENIKKCFSLLENDYLGGGGTRGSGRVKFENIRLNYKLVFEEDIKKELENKLNKILEV